MRQAAQEARQLLSGIGLRGREAEQIHDALAQSRIGFVELRRAFVYLTSNIEPNKEVEVREALLSAKAEFEPVKEHAMSLLEHLEQRGAARG